MSDESNGRTHEPNLRELTAELDGTRALLLSKLESLEKLMDERDRLYKERDDARRVAVDAAFAAAKEQTKTTFDSGKEAIVKAENAQRDYNTAHNDLARKMDDQNKATMPRSETEARFHSIEEKVGEIKTVVATGGASAQGGKAFKDESRANAALVMSVLGILIILWRLTQGQ